MHNPGSCKEDWGCERYAMPHKLVTSINTPLHSQGVPLECASRSSLYSFYPVYLQIPWGRDLSSSIFVGTIEVGGVGAL